MTQTTGNHRHFFFLQGPHGPFFQQLGRMLRHTGAKVWRVGFNKGDEVFWRDKRSFIPFLERPEDWPARFSALIGQHEITDIVLYGDTRPIHAKAVAIAKAHNITVHVFEEGYLRPYWISYERGGSNGNSALMALSVEDMQTALKGRQLDLPDVPAHWGDMRHHMFYGALYHWFVMCLNSKYKHFRPHRSLGVVAEFRLYLRRLLLMPFLALDRIIATGRIKRGGFPYHIALLQLEHDSSFQKHSPFNNMCEFLDVLVKGFSKGAAPHHHLVFKAHPLEDGRAPLRRDIRKLARRYGVEDRVHYVRGGKLARLLDHARSAVTVNSTAAQQVLWRGLPLKLFGTAVFDKPAFASTQKIEDFFALPDKPDGRAYRDYRHYLLETSQITGGFYSARGRRQALRQVVDLMLAADDPYQALAQGTAAPRQQLRLVN